jgi:hypothetical protein
LEKEVTVDTVGMVVKCMDEVDPTEDTRIMKDVRV